MPAAYLRMVPNGDCSRICSIYGKGFGMPIGKTARIAIIALCAFVLASACACAPKPEWHEDGAEAPTESFAPGFEAVDSMASGGMAAAEPQPVELPAHFDLRDRGVVTPVKTQNPWGTCWAFSAIAAAETSILSSEGTTYDETGLDLSELHLSWFPFIAVTETESASQAGEGLYLADSGDDANAPLRDGAGFGPIITALLASGGGPVSEEEFPYRGSTGMTEHEFYSANPDDAMALVVEDIERNNDMSFEEYAAQNYPSLDPDTVLELEYEAYTQYYGIEDCFSSEDDWSIPNANDAGQSNRLASGSWELTDANYLPQLCERSNGAWTGLSDVGMRAAKEQLLAGRGIAVCLAADQARPDDWGSDTYMNTSTWAHYTFIDEPINHEVCIVGWDDNYSSSNFIYGAEPPGNGAWIAKNSWGSETESSATEEAAGVGRSPWGVIDENGLHTGYFYISYYDKSLTDPMTLEFAEAPATNTLVEQYDFLPGIAGTYRLQSSDELKAANVFTAQTDEEIYAVSAVVPDEDVHVRFDVRILDDEEAGPEDGTLAASIWQRFDYEGYHRIDLPEPVSAKAGQRFSVTCTAFTIDEEGHRHYTAYANIDDSSPRGPGEEQAESEDPPIYAHAVVNAGESYLFDGSSWKDWTDQIGKLGDSYENTEIDNFSIKAYARTAE